jgi:HD superfamily phosphodiesterase
MDSINKINEENMLLNNIILLCENYVIETCKKYNIDKSHDISHSRDVLKYANIMINNRNLTFLQKKIITICALLHDMCDEKYIDINIGCKQISNFLSNNNIVSTDVIELILNIVKTMSYSKVKKNGYPIFNNDEIELCYHIIRNADLLSAYDPDRCINYHYNNILKDKKNKQQSIISMIELFDNRVFKYISDGYINLPDAIKIAKKLEFDAKLYINKYYDI